MSAYTYEYSGASYKVSAQVVGELCEQLEMNGGLTPKALLDASRDPSSPTHCVFEWDDTVAAEKYRIEQARLLISRIRVIQTTDMEERQAQKERAFVSTPGGTSVYASLNNALQKDEWKNYLLEQARRDMELFAAKYRRLEQLASVIDPMLAFLKNVS